MEIAAYLTTIILEGLYSKLSPSYDLLPIDLKSYNNILKWLTFIHATAAEIYSASPLDIATDTGR